MKRGRLLGRWSKRERDFLFSYPSKPDGHFIHQLFSCVKINGKTLIENFTERGYDLTTLRLQIDLLPRKDPP